MSTIDAIHKFINNPFPLWEVELTELLVQNKWKDLKKNNILSVEQYSSARCISDNNLPLPHKYLISENEKTYLELPSFNHLDDFNFEHGLNEYSLQDIETSNAFQKLKSALNLINLVPSAHVCITKLVKSIHVLSQKDSEIDTSYSHPNIPFSIFVSVCEDDSLLSSLRVAESIIHEAMHLKLTLIENITPLIKPNSKEMFYSPWRDEPRPIRGVLHGLFVFKAILDFYTILMQQIDFKSLNFLAIRTTEIRKEFYFLMNFQKSNDLSQEARVLVSNLLRF